MHHETHADVIVVGAGVSGLTAAGLLQRAGLRVIVFEARDRIGGRLWTDRSDHTPTDLGASWIHGITDSAVLSLTDGFGMPRIEFTVGSYQAGGRPIAYYGPDGQRLSDAAREGFVADVAAADEALVSVIAAAPQNSSYAEVVEIALSQLGWDAERAERVREFFRHRTEEQYGAWIADLDAHGLDDDSISGDEVVFPEGYDVLAHKLAAGLDIRCEHCVTEVRRDAVSATVSVVTGGETFSASHVVLTVPVGVLHAEEISFVPPLPQHHLQALQGLEMNAFEKIFLRFPKKFWDENVYAIRQQGPAGEWWHSWYDLTPLHGEPTLLTFAAGPCAREIRHWESERIIASVLDALRRLYGDAVCEPERVDITDWQGDPYTHGAYAYLRVGANPSDHDALAVPIDGVLHLAGEATWADDPATVTAAVLSGLRAAEHIVGAPLQLTSLLMP